MQSVIIVSALVALGAIVVLALNLKKLAALKHENIVLKSEKAVIEERLKSKEETFMLLKEERDKVIESQRKEMEESFKRLSEQNSAGLRNQNRDSLEVLLKPIKEKFEEFDKTMKANRESAVKMDAEMKLRLDSLMERSDNLGQDAKNLTDALAGRSKVQGDFGEMQLTSLLKSAGLTEGIHFDAQEYIRDASGHMIKSEENTRMIPDVIVHYPDDTDLIIDSKVSLTAYTKYVAAELSEDRNKFAKEHVESVRKHVEELKSKDYASYIVSERKKVDYNIMFIPTEGAFTLMMDVDPLLWQRAWESKVLIVNQMNLMVVLNMIAMGWKQRDQEKNILKVYDTAAELMSQISRWLDSFVKLGKILEGAQKAYDEAKNRLCDSNQSVVKKVDKLERLGAAPKRLGGKLKSNSRVVNSRESVIPQELSYGLETHDEELEIEQV